MNYKALLDKLAELEARIDALERGQPKQLEFPPAPQFVENTPRNWQSSFWPITSKGTIQ